MRLVTSPIGVLLLTICLSPAIPAAEVHLKNGTSVAGNAVPIQGLHPSDIQRDAGTFTRAYPILMIDTGMRRYLVPARQVSNIDHTSAVVTNEENFALRQQKSPRKKMFSTLGGVEVINDFDEFGRRVVAVNTPRGKLQIVQGITELNPRHVTVEAMTELEWKHGVAVTSLEEETLDQLLHRAIDPNKPQDRMGVAVFYMQAGMYLRAAAELDAIVRDFPPLQATAEEVLAELRKTQAEQLLRELRLRRRAGQHKLAAVALDQFPKNLGAAVDKQVADHRAELKRLYEQHDLVLARLATLQNLVARPDLRSQLEAVRAALRSELDLEGLPRLDAFLKFEGDLTLSADQKLALAYSGWLLGGANAITDLEQTLRLWTARHLVLEALRTYEVNALESLVTHLSETEGVRPEVLAQMLQNLPPLIETPGIEQAQAFEVEAQRDLAPGQPLRYRVMLPHEYSPNHAYPVVISLHGEGRDPEWSTRWWGGTPEEPGQAPRRGYVVIAPEYIEADSVDYSPTPRMHEIILGALADASKRFHLDRDRVFLSGHGLGGGVAWDLGLTRPDVFAGVIPITGLCGSPSQLKWENGQLTSWYVIGGELAASSLQNEDYADMLMRMMRQGYRFDLMYVEYIGRGYESFYEEIHRLFDWMDRHQRLPDPKEIEAETVGDRDARMFWVKAEGLPATALTRPLDFEAKISDGAAERISISLATGADVHLVWLSPTLVDYASRLRITVRGKQKYNDFPKASLADLLEDFRNRADRQRLYWTKIVVE